MPTTVPLIFPTASPKLWAEPTATTDPSPRTSQPPVPSGRTAMPTTRAVVDGATGCVAFGAGRVVVAGWGGAAAGGVLTVTAGPAPPTFPGEVVASGTWLT